MIERFDNFVTGITHIYKSLFKIKKQEMKGINLKGIHVMCLFNVKHSDMPLTLTQLSALCAEDKAAMSRTVTYLCENGYLVYSEGQKYRATLSLTDKGRAASDDLDIMVTRAVAAGGDGLTDEERQIFYKCLGHISANLKKYANEIQE